MEFPLSANFRGDEVKTLAGRSHLPSAFRTKMELHTDAPRITIQLHESRGDDAVVRLVIWQEDHVDWQKEPVESILDVWEMATDLTKIKRFFALREKQVESDEAELFKGSNI